MNMKTRNIKPGYLADVEVIEGLAVTYERKKIINNCNRYEIEMNLEKDENWIRLSKRDKHVIILVKEVDYFLQFKVTDKFNRDVIPFLKDELFPPEVFEAIVQASFLTKEITLEDLLN